MKHMPMCPFLSAVTGTPQSIPYGMCPYLVFLACEVSELTGDDGLAYEVEEFILVIDILILLLYAEYRSLARTVTGTKQYMTSERREWLSAVEIPFTLYLLISVLVIDATAPTGHIDRVVIEEFKLTIQLCNIVTGSCSRIENLVFEPAEHCQDMPCTL